MHDTPTCVTSSYTYGILHDQTLFAGLFGVKLHCTLFAHFFTAVLFQREWLVGTNVAALSGIRPDGGAGCKGTHGHAFVHIHSHKPAHKHTHVLTHAGTHPLHVSVFAQAGFLSLCLPPPFLQPVVVTLVASWLKW